MPISRYVSALALPSAAGAPCGIPHMEGIFGMSREKEFQIQRAKDGGYWWHLVAANGETVCSSQVYTTFDACKDGAFWVRNNAAEATVYDYTKD
jgi:uncharacterized protein YegP (UPF0339 family)